MVSNLVEDSIDKSSRVFGAKFFANVDSLVDGNLRRDILAVEKLIYCHSENVSIDMGHAAHLPVLSILFYQAINFIAVLDHSPDQMFIKISGLLVRSEIILEEIQSLSHLPVGHINLVKNLEGKLPPASPNSQG